MPRKLYRQGDIVLEEVESLPREINFQGFELSLVGETGHAHVLPGKVYAPTEEEANSPFRRFIEVELGGASMVHPEHPSLELPKGFYSIRRLRSFTPAKIEDVVD